MGRQGTSSTRSKASASGTPTGRKPSTAVYRRRRLFVGAALLMVMAMVFGGFAVGGAFRSNSDQASATGNPTESPGNSAPAAAPSATASSTPTPTQPKCNQNLITVSASTDKAAYGPDEKPLLTMKVTNGGTVACEVNIGTSQMDFVVTSGPDRIFSSRDCQAKSEDLLKVIEPGASETANFPWARNRTLEGCEPIEAKPGAGGAYYIFTAKLGSRASPKAVFQLS